MTKVGSSTASAISMDDLRYSLAVSQDRNDERAISTVFSHQWMKVASSRTGRTWTETRSSSRIRVRENGCNASTAAEYAESESKFLLEYAGYDFFQTSLNFEVVGDGPDDAHLARATGLDAFCYQLAGIDK